MFHEVCFDVKDLYLMKKISAYQGGYFVDADDEVRGMLRDECMNKD
jgi:hypothetical protein